MHAYWDHRWTIVTVQWTVGVLLWMQAIDGIDNGINLYDTDKLPRYANDTHLSARVGRLNPDWMDEQTSEAEDEAFRKAMSLTGVEFLEV